MVTFAHYPDSGMSYPDPNQGGGYPPPPDHSQSQYPPPPGSEEDERRAYHQRVPSASAPVTLPSISPYEYAQQPQQQPYIPDPRAYAPDPYGPPPPQGPYRDDRGYPQQDYGRGGGGMGGPGGSAGQMATFNQSAPRQRTAIACRYCRRRKIRCSGFDQSPTGRCINCERFQQECIFTPVSSQAQAFVPAHAAYPAMRNMGIGPDGRVSQMYSQPGPPQLYGAHGQPLGPIPRQQQMGYEYPAPSPTGSYRSYVGDEPGTSSQHQQQQQQPQPQDQSRKRPQQDPHPSILPPPLPPGQSYARSDSAQRRQAAEDDLRLPPVTPTVPGASTSNQASNQASNPANYSPGSSTSSHSNLQPPQTGPVMSRTPPPRSSPGGDSSRQDPMSLGNIMQGRPDTQIDRSMLGRLDRPRQ